MIQSRSTRAVLTALLALGLPAVAAAQAPAPANASEAQVEEWFAEFQQVHQQLESIQAQALQDPQLSAAQEELGQEIQLAMATADPNR